ncbi:MAG: AMP-binding protein, partial [Cyanobacteria bacterium P01_F01_bin.150]
MSINISVNSIDTLNHHLQQLGYSEVGVQWNELYVCKEAITLRSKSCLPIGQPIANAEVYILDKNLQLSPIGVPGEVYVGGSVLSRGYLNQPALTSERFISHPFHQNSSSRIYRTGDLARYLPDGNIEYLGRLDHQVKIRGFRIETSEIEAVLCQHKGVRNAVVIVNGDGLNKRLVAYLISHCSAASLVAHTRQFLKERLPDYMVPTAFMVLEQLPLTPNGKVDRRALPAPDLTTITADYVAPRTPTEQAIAD